MVNLSTPVDSLASYYEDVFGVDFVHATDDSNRYQLQAHQMQVERVTGLLDDVSARMEATAPNASLAYEVVKAPYGEAYLVDSVITGDEHAQEAFKAALIDTKQSYRQRGEIRSAMFDIAGDRAVVRVAGLGIDEVLTIDARGNAQTEEQVGKVLDEMNRQLESQGLEPARLSQIGTEIRVDIPNASRGPFADLAKTANKEHWKFQDFEQQRADALDVTLNQHAQEREFADLLDIAALEHDFKQFGKLAPAQDSFAAPAPVTPQSLPDVVPQR